MKNKKVQANVEALMPDLIQAWRRFLKIKGPEDVLQTREFRSVCDEIIRLEAAYKEKKTPKYTREAIAASLLYYFPLHYQEGLSLIGELPDVPHKVVDVGSGLAPFSFGALKLGAKEVYALDQNEDQLRLGAEAIGRQGFPISFRKWSYPNKNLPVEGPIDLIIFTYSIDEFFQQSSEQLYSFIQELLSKLSDKGHLLLVERSDLDHNKTILQLRDHFVSQGVAIQAPCVYKGPCPALDAKSLCYAQREFEKPYLVKEIQRKAGIFLNSLKMSYLILKSPKASWPEVPEPCFRVISPPIETDFGDKKYYLCGTTGKKQIFEKKDEKLYLQRGALISLGTDSEHKIKKLFDPGQPLRW